MQFSGLNDLVILIMLYSPSHILNNIKYSVLLIRAALY